MKISIKNFLIWIESRIKNFPSYTFKSPISQQRSDDWKSQIFQLSKLVKLASPLNFQSLSSLRKISHFYLFFFKRLKHVLKLDEKFETGNPTMRSCSLLRRFSSLARYPYRSYGVIIVCRDTALYNNDTYICAFIKENVCKIKMLLELCAWKQPSRVKPITRRH